MKVQFLTGPRTGEFTHVERSATTQLLIDAGMVKEVSDAPPVSNTPTFTMGRLPWSDLPVLIGTVGQRTEFYDGPDPVAYFNRIGLQGISEELVGKFLEQQKAMIATQSKPVPGKRILSSANDWANTNRTYRRDG
jgi:hypothetical protein